jgi:protein NrfD
MNDPLIARRDSGGSYSGPSYYGQPQLKPSPFGWKVSLYIYVAGLAGSSQLLAALGDIFGGRRARGMVRRGRYLSILGITLGPLLLILDLATPRRFYNMLRIFRPTSPMSMGTYVLTTFGMFASTTAALQFVADRMLKSPLHWLRLLARIAQVPAALAGGGMSIYTASLQSATSTPLWAASPRRMAVRYGASSIASAAAALSIGERMAGPGRMAARLDALALVALTVELGATLASARDYRRKGVAEVLDTGALGAAEAVGVVGLGTLLPIALYSTALLGRRSGSMSKAASVATLAGGMALRHVMLVAGNESARRPAASFALAQPRNLPNP